MNRRKFLKTTGIAAAGAVTAPFILPSGRLFAATGSQLAEHVVLVMFAGGVRQQETVLKRYLDDSQGLNGIGGNIMYNMLNGAAPTQKIVYGTDIPNQPLGIQPIPKILSNTIESQGTTFHEAVASNPGHYGGLNVMLTGSGAASQGLKQKPLKPTVFEYARRHLGLPASKCWFVGNGIGNSIPLLNFSSHENYGADYGANFLAPNITFGAGGVDHLSNAKVYHPEEELSPMYQMKYFLDNTFRGNGGSLLNYSMWNTEEEKQDIKQFFDTMFTSGASSMPPVTDNGDLSNVGYAMEVLKWFKPNLLAINMSAVDGCHGNFTGYLRSIHRADHAVGHIWNTIQNDPVLKDNTIMIIAPECGRNLNSNPIKDENDWFGFDHSDANTRRVFVQMVGPNVPANLGVGSEGNSKGTTQEIAVSIAEILGFKPEMQAAGIAASQSLFDQI